MKRTVGKRTIATVFLLALGTGAHAQVNPVNEPAWRSPFTAAPGLSGISPLTAERNHKAAEQDLAAWRARHTATARTDRPASTASTQTQPAYTAPRK